MYEAKTYEALMQEKLARVSSKLDRREGSIIFDAMAPNAVESAQMYAAIDDTYDETFADTASRPNLIKRCAERSIYPRAATFAVAIGEFNIDVPLEEVFSLGLYNWRVTTKIETGRFYLTCNTAGAAPNASTGLLIPNEHVEGLTGAQLTEVVINGEDAEDTEALRKRYFKSFFNKAYGFNRAQYIEVIGDMQGVGGVKPYRAFYGPGTVKVVITDSEYGVPSPTLVDTVQTAIDPTVNAGEGLGLTACDHVVTIVGVTGVDIDVSTTLTLTAGWELEDVLPYIQTAIDSYCAELNAEWEASEGLIVRIAQIEARIIALDGILDITGTTINGEAENLVLAADEIAVRGAFTNA